MKFLFLFSFLFLYESHPSYKPSYLSNAERQSKLCLQLASDHNKESDIGNAKNNPDVEREHFSKDKPRNAK